jgi:hypothetical protein
LSAGKRVEMGPIPGEGKASNEISVGFAFILLKLMLDFWVSTISGKVEQVSSRKTELRDSGRVNLLIAVSENKKCFIKL